MGLYDVVSAYNIIYSYKQYSVQGTWHATTSASYTLRPRQNDPYIADDIFKHIFLNEKLRILIIISLKFVPKNPINNNSALV